MAGVWAGVAIGVGLAVGLGAGLGVGLPDAAEKTGQHMENSARITAELKYQETVETQRVEGLRIDSEKEQFDMALAFDEKESAKDTAEALQFTRTLNASMGIEQDDRHIQRLSRNNSSSNQAAYPDHNYPNPQNQGNRQV